jgi:hypothetical protein
MKNAPPGARPGGTQRLTTKFANVDLNSATPAAAQAVRTKPPDHLAAERSRATARDRALATLELAAARKRHREAQGGWPKPEIGEGEFVRRGWALLDAHSRRRAMQVRMADARLRTMIRILAAEHSMSARFIRLCPGRI